MGILLSGQSGDDNSGALNVREYGAVGDGVTDDRAACQAAITAIGSSGGTVLFPPGNYLIVPSAGIGLTIANPNIRLEGARSGASKITASTNCASGLICLVGGAQLAGTTWHYRL